MKYGLTRMGTNAHELPMVYSAIYRAEDETARRLVSQARVLGDWEQQYGLGLSIFLPDTFGSDYSSPKLLGAANCPRGRAPATTPVLQKITVKSEFACTSRPESIRERS